jgi:hypothetical protein
LQRVQGDLPYIGQIAGIAIASSGYKQPIDPTLNTNQISFGGLELFQSTFLF